MPNRLMTWKEQALLAVLAGALALGAVTLYLVGRPHTPTIRPVPETSAHAPAADSAPALHVEPMGPAPPPPIAAPAPKIVVEVKGAVRKPDVYRLPEGSRVDDLLAEAGGSLDEADLSGINRAAILLDASTLVVPTGGQGASRYGHQLAENPAQYLVAGQTAAQTYTTGAVANAGGSSAGAAQGLVNLNTASQAELETLPRVGPVTAQKIMDYRNSTPFQRVEDLLNISGIGEKTLEGMRPHVTVR